MTCSACRKGNRLCLEWKRLTVIGALRSWQNILKQKSAATLVTFYCCPLSPHVFSDMCTTSHVLSNNNHWSQSEWNVKSMVLKSQMYKKTELAVASYCDQHERHTHPEWHIWHQHICSCCSEWTLESLSGFRGLERYQHIKLKALSVFICTQSSCLRSDFWTIVVIFYNSAVLTRSLSMKMSAVIRYKEYKEHAEQSGLEMQIMKCVVAASFMLLKDQITSQIRNAADLRRS